MFGIKNLKINDPSYFIAPYSDGGYFCWHPFMVNYKSEALKLKWNGFLVIAKYGL